MNEKYKIQNMTVYAKIELLLLVLIETASVYDFDGFLSCIESKIKNRVGNG